MAITEGTFLVGGAVRDRLLGREVVDRDWVVVGQTPEAMLAQGYTQVGKDFPVFLHPETHEEYALARTERKIGAGHQGFECHAGIDVTLEEDLLRRDLTVNALAQTPEGKLVDPYGGEQDLRNGVLRHVSAAFSEDPLRVLRVARFAAQLGFSVAPETQTLLGEMAAADALAELPAERVWQEFHKALGCAGAATFVRCLREVSALAPWFVEFEHLDNESLAHWPGGSAVQRYAGLGLLLEAAAIDRCGRRLKAPKRFERVGQAVANHGETLLGWSTAEPETLLRALQQSGALQLDAQERRDDFLEVLAVLEEARGDMDSGALALLANGVAVLSAEAAIAAAQQRGDQLPQGKALGDAIFALRTERIAQAQGR